MVNQPSSVWLTVYLSTLVPKNMSGLPLLMRKLPWQFNPREFWLVLRHQVLITATAIFRFGQPELPVHLE